ncbi:MAG: rod shape-determining protein RodA [Flavobacteriales bacterium]|nr:rod shape-determining protein RodA [Flavobacteriales bacterium]
MARRISIWKYIDKYLLILFLLLLVGGYLTIYSSSFDGLNETGSFWSTSSGKQLIWVIISLLIGSIVLLVEGSFIHNSSYIVYVIVLLLLVGVLFMPAIKGAKSWFQFGSFSIQPSEFAKLSCSLAFARYLSSINVKFQDFRTRIKVISILIFPAILIVLQPDPGTMLVFISFVFVMYREGLSGNILLIGLLAIIIAVIGIFLKASETNFDLLGSSISGNMFFGFILLLISVLSFLIIKFFVLPRYRKEKFYRLAIVTVIGIVISLGVNHVYDNLFKDRHRNRFQIMFGIKEDRTGDGYNIYQALSAIGSGEGTGKGYLQGTLSNDKYKHVPEQSTDFIFCSWAEEWGFLGGLLFIIVYIATLIRIVMLAERQRSKFTRIFGYCVASVLFFHFMINIGMVTGLAPVIGIPLPFFSKGGSAVLTFSLLIFILLRLDAERKVVLR